MTKAKVCIGAFLLSAFGLVSMSLAGQAKPPPNPQEAGRQAGRVTNEINQATGRLRSGETAQAGINQVQRLADQTGRFRDQVRDAKRKADDAAKAAEKAKEAAMKAARECNDANLRAARRAMEEAVNKETEAQQAKNRADTRMKELKDQAENIVKGVNDNLNNLQNRANQALADAKAAGLKDSDHSVDSLQKAQQALQRERANQSNEGTRENNFRDQGSLNKLEKAKEQLNTRLNDIKNENDPQPSLDRAAQLLRDARAYLEDCPPKPKPQPGVSFIPKQQVDVFVGMDNRPQVNVCIAAGQDAKQAANALGLGQHQVVASTQTGTVVRAPGDPKTVEKEAKQQGIGLCFPPEFDYCMIMTPLTPFRGHNHEAHQKSGRALHDHYAPDPPLDWGVTPPETVIRWEGK